VTRRRHRVHETTPGDHAGQAVEQAGVLRGASTANTPVAQATRSEVRARPPGCSSDNNGQHCWPSPVQTQRSIRRGATARACVDRPRRRDLRVNARAAPPSNMRCAYSTCRGLLRGTGGPAAEGLACGEQHGAPSLREACDAFAKHIALGIGHDVRPPRLAARAGSPTTAVGLPHIPGLRDLVGKRHKIGLQTMAAALATEPDSLSRRTAR